MRTAARIGIGLAGLAVVGGAAVYAVPRLVAPGAATPEQRLGAKPGTTPAAAAPAGAAFTLVATGDIIPYPSIVQRSAQDAGTAGEYDFRKILAGVKPLVAAADLAVCHHEIPYGKPGGPYTGYPTFKAPHQLADALKDAGYDSCSTASNHTLDDGWDGLVRTLDHLDRAGVRHVGSARGAEEAKAPALLSAGGAKVAQLAYTYGTNGIPLPQGKPWAVNLIDQERIIADARAARAAGANVVVLSVHWGTEWQTAPDQQQRDLAGALTASRGTDGLPDIDLVIGTHNHVPQPYEKINGTWVVFGMGDQVASFVPADKLRGNQSSVPRFTFAPSASHVGRWEVVKAEYLTQYSDMGPPFRVVCASCAEGDTGLSAVKRAEYARIDKEVTAAVMSRGAAASGLERATR
ncbi:CapA family protein [Streptomyces sp. NBC_00249]|uniref:CapA family protein n=1 Tax=Streptomyces sp. NBC_00249 TaxID=2975690 RepID=UPI00225847A5|nr:CapA family protein [Streptomyces sp. NBC_00249]MCX5196544.1 CapA family protein [Streptomyces sp. NBC_00249]